MPDLYAGVYAALLERLPPLPPFPPPWDFLAPPADCRGTASDPGAVAAALLAEVGGELLAGSGVGRPTPGGGWTLAPGLAAPGGAVVPLRRGPGLPPFALLTPRGCLPAAPVPALVALRDDWTARRAARAGVLFAPARVGEVVLLRALGLPAALPVGLGRAAPPALRAVDRRFAGQPLPGGPGAARPALALAAWSPLAVSAAVPGPVAHAAAGVAAAREHLGLGLAGVGAWRPAAADLAALRYRLATRDPRLVRRALLDSADPLGDVAALAAPPPPPADYPEALEALVAALAAEADGAAAPGRAARARRAFEAAVGRELTGPLRAQALAAADPAVRAAGVELAAAAGLLHRMAPLLAAAQDRRFAAALGGRADPLPPGALGQYLAVARQFGGLLRDLRRPGAP